jgi:hypothetical protein
MTIYLISGNICFGGESLLVCYFWMMTLFEMAKDGVKLLMSNDKMMTLIIMNYTVQVGGAGCEGAAQLCVCVYRGGGKEARPKKHSAR